MAPASRTQRSPGEAPASSAKGHLERLGAGSGYFCAGIGLALAGGLVVAVVLQDLFAHLLGWAIHSGLGPVATVVAAILVVGAGVVIGRRLARRRSS